MSLTTDPKDPRLSERAGENKKGQNEVYLVLSEEERAKGFVRPLRRSYRHVGIRPKHPTRDLTDREKEMYGDVFSCFEEYPPEELPSVGRFWTAKELSSGCGSSTKMKLALCETYARKPDFYGSTFCCTCNTHFPVEEFVWEEDGKVVGS